LSLLAAGDAEGKQRNGQNSEGRHEIYSSSRLASEHNSVGGALTAMGRHGESFVSSLQFL
jgi:hypothetical protein